jgi:hypothetical protein
VRVYDDARHEILNEINRAEVIADLAQWLQRVSMLPAVHETPESSAKARTNQ